MFGKLKVFQAENASDCEDEEEEPTQSVLVWNEDSDLDGPETFKSILTEVKTGDSPSKNKKLTIIRMVVIILVLWILLIVYLIEEFLKKKETWLLLKLQKAFGMGYTDQFLPLATVEFLTSSDSQFLMLTHIMLTFYISVDALKATKVIYVSMVLSFTGYLLKVISQDPPAFWISGEIVSYTCANAYQMPSIESFVFPFILFYIRYAFRGNKSIGKWVNVFVFLAFFCSLFLYAGVYLTGDTFIYQLVIGFLYFIISIVVVIFMDDHIEKGVRKLTISVAKSKVRVFNLMLLVILVMTITYLYAFLSSESPNVEWLQNYINCQHGWGRTLESQLPSTAIGLTNNTSESCCLLALIGGAFGANKAFVETETGIFWSHGTRFERFQRGVILNLYISLFWVVPVINIFLWDNQIAKGIIWGVSLFLIYYVGMGPIPVILVNKFKLTSSALIRPQ